MKRLVLFTAFALVSCASVLGIEDRSVSDAGTETPVDSGPPVERDATPTVTDSGPAPVDGSPSPPSYCASRGAEASFCDDFESAEPLSARWVPTIAGGATLTVVPEAGASGGAKSLSLVLPTSGESSACLTRELTGTFTTMRIGLDVRIVTAGTTGPLDFFRVGPTTIDGANVPNVELELSPQGEISVDDESSVLLPKKKTPIEKSVTMDWAHLDVVILVEQTSLSIEVAVNGQSGKRVLTQEATPLKEAKTFVSLGDCATSGSLRWKVQLDNFDVQNR